MIRSLPRHVVFVLLSLWSTFDASYATSGHGATNPRKASSDDRAIPIINNILDRIDGWMYSSSTSSALTSRPFVTVSFAQSLDAKIALYVEDENRTSANYPLSGPESLLLTHGLRSIHDGILVGGRTLSTDNPRLTNRLWNVLPSSKEPKQPRPIVLDSELQHVRKCLASGSLKAKNLIVCCSREAAAAEATVSIDGITAMEPSITLLPCDMCRDGMLLDLKSVLFRLKVEFGIQNIMVEGGAAVISAFLQGNLADCLCITVAPVVLGSRGLATFSFGPDGKRDPIDLDGIECVSLGNDCILLSRIPVDYG